MSLDNGRHADSPSLSSGRDSPALAKQRIARFRGDDESLKHDKSYRRYASAVERTLGTFDPTLEWPDYISFLGRLLKAIQSHPSEIDNLPHKSLVANRLAQCLTPSLPSGVHQKALELYSYIFSLLSQDSLARDLPVFLPGLSPVLTFASLTLRPAYFSLVENYIVKINAKSLRPALRALLLCLLPGLEEESSEEFERTLALLDTLKDALNPNSSASDIRAKGFGDEHFWQCLFLASIGSKSRRAGALAYLARRLPRLGPVDQAGSPLGVDKILDASIEPELPAAAESIISPEPGLLIRCMATGLEDEQPLIQRGFLDLLVSHLPLHSPVLTSRVAVADLNQLASAAINVVARRDMSLNRRLWSWFTGPQSISQDGELASDLQSDDLTSPLDQKPPSHTSYFQEFGLKPLASSVLSMIRQSGPSPTAQARPFRICLSLMDRQEIGAFMIHDVFEAAMNRLLLYQKSATVEDFSEVLRSANSFFDGIESGVIWAELLQLARSAMEASKLEGLERQRKLELIQFIVSNFNIREEEMLAFHIPLFTAYLMTSLNALQTDTFVTQLQAPAIALLEKLVAQMPERVSLNDSFAENGTEGTARSGATADDTRIIQRIEAFYFTHRGNITISPPPFTSRKTADILLEQSSTVYQQGLKHQPAPAIREARCKIFSNVLSKVPENNVVETEQVFQSIRKDLDWILDSRHNKAFTLFSSHVEVLANLLHSIPSADSVNMSLLQDIVQTLTIQFWAFLTPSYPKYHVEAVRNIWQLSDLVPQHNLVEAAVSSFLVTTPPSQVAESQDAKLTESARRFAVLWNHTVLPPGSNNKRVQGRGSVASQNRMQHDLGAYEKMLYRPLLLLLEGLSNPDTELGYFLRGWLQSLPSLYNVFSLLLSQLNEARRQLQQAHAKDVDGHRILQDQHNDTGEECLYFLRHLQSLLSLSPEATASSLSMTMLSSTEPASEETQDLRLDYLLAQSCIELVQTDASSCQRSTVQNSLKRVALSVLMLLLRRPAAHVLKDLYMDEVFVEVLRRELKSKVADFSVFVVLLDAINASLRLKFSLASLRDGKSDDKANQDGLPQIPVPPQLMQCVQEGISAPASQLALDHWIRFLMDILPLQVDGFFQSIISLVEGFCKEITIKFDKLQAMYRLDGPEQISSSEAALVALMDGLEHILGTAHDRLTIEEGKAAAVKSPEPAQGFFGGVVSGVFSGDSSKGKTSLANTRLTVLLCFQDAVRICYSIWSWGSKDEISTQDAASASSFSYISVRMRNKARRMLDRMFAVEPLECLETIIVQWNMLREDQSQASLPMTLLHVLGHSRPKIVMPAIFNALYSRTNPSAIDSSRTSSLTSDIAVSELGQFLVAYTEALDDDAMDEIWQDCISFLRDVLANPLPQSQILPLLLNFVLLLAQKLEKTNFGDSRRMRKDLGDLFMRVLTAAFTTRSTMNFQEPSATLADGVTVKNGDVKGGSRPGSRKVKFVDMFDVLNIVVPQAQTILVDAERVQNAVSSISSNAINPVVHAKAFPLNLKNSQLELVVNLTKLSTPSKTLKKDVSDLLNNPKLFSASRDLAEKYLLPIMRQATISDKDRLPDLIARIPAPTSAGIVFGVGASAARLDADKKTQLNLRRIALTILAMDVDYVVTPFEQLEVKITELLNATPSSSPSSNTRAEVFMVLRAMVLRTSSTHLAPAWPLITSELQKALASALPRTTDYETYTTPSLLQACNLLDLLLVTSPDDFQLYQWLFITDTIDAVYRPPDYEPVGLADEIAEDLGASEATLPGVNMGRTPTTPTIDTAIPDKTVTALESPYKRSTLLEQMLQRHDAVSGMNKEEFVSRVLRPWFARLSMHAYEATYSLNEPDWEGCQRSLIWDLFDDVTLVG